jgi:NAD(P)-dependent dehydrogenase (short-subunit alcohol dehydrogenase family)
METGTSGDRKAMKVRNKTVVVTGAGSGIGRALSLRFAAEGARVAVADLDELSARETAERIDGLAVACDVAKEADISDLVARAERRFGPIDLFCSNAGILVGEPGNVASASNEVWQANWDIHVMAHVYAARAALPGMIARGGGYFLQMISAAGLLNQIGDAAYSTTKHAALGFAEALAITHGDDGIKVSAVCPQFVATPMLGYGEGEGIDNGRGIIGPEQVADSVMAGLEEERFLILPHPQIEAYRQNKAADYDRWINGMKRLRRDVVGEPGTPDIKSLHRRI